jgi:hypothetical protein
LKVAGTFRLGDDGSHLFPAVNNWKATILLFWIKPVLKKIAYEDGPGFLTQSLGVNRTMTIDRKVV